MKRAAFVLLTLTFARLGHAQTEYDLLLKGGHVIDGRNGISAVRDVAIKNGKMAAVATNIPASQAERDDARPVGYRLARKSGRRSAVGRDFSRTPSRPTAGSIAGVV